MLFDCGYLSIGFYFLLGSIQTWLEHTHSPIAYQRSKEGNEMGSWGGCQEESNKKTIVGYFNDDYWLLQLFANSLSGHGQGLGFSNVYGSLQELWWRKKNRNRTTRNAFRVLNNYVFPRPQLQISSQQFLAMIARNGKERREKQTL